MEIKFSTYPIANKNIMDSSKKQKYPCAHCEQGFTVLSNLNDHVRKFHGPTKKCFKCTYCPSKFLLKSSVTDHYSKQHPGKHIRFKYQVCDYSTIEDKNLVNKLYESDSKSQRRVENENERCLQEKAENSDVESESGKSCDSSHSEHETLEENEDELDDMLAKDNSTKRQTGDKRFLRSLSCPKCPEMFRRKEAQVSGIYVWTLVQII